MTPARIDAAGRQALERWLGARFGAPCVIRDIRPLSGGAIQENWLVEAEIGGDRRDMVLRKDAPAAIAASHSRADEFAILAAVHAAGVRTPEPLACCDDESVIGARFALMARVEGIGFGPRIVKDVSLGGDRERLVAEIGAQFARIHALRPPQPALAFLGAPPADPVAADVAWLRGSLDAMGLARPALEWGLRFLELHLTPSSAVTMVHRDLRTGNYMVDAGGLTAILDWEFAGWGDPLSDIGWFCAGCWRFGRSDLEAGGVGSRAALYAGYEAAGGMPIDDARVRLWEIMAHIRWAVIALQQGARHLSGAEPSLALALTSRIVPELELAVLRATAPVQPVDQPAMAATSAPQAGEADGATLLQAAGALLADTLLPKLAGADRVDALMIASAMRMAARELGALRRPLIDEAATVAQVAAIRRGAADGDAALHHSLLSRAAAGVALTRPELLSENERALLRS
jgi:aminoglycoside phosphotransferase (APT) family kinase protein